MCEYVSFSEQNDSFRESNKWWHQQKTFRITCKVICLVGVIATTAIAILLLTLIIHFSSKSTTYIDVNVDNIKQPDICTRLQCVQEASRILSTSDKSINPCDDFYGFACGGFVQNALYAPGKIQMNFFTAAEDRLANRLYYLLTTQNVVEAKPFQLAKTFFGGCNNQTWQIESGLKQLRAIVEHLGGWPVVEGSAWNATAWTWQTVMTEMRRKGAFADNLLFKMSIENRRMFNNLQDAYVSDGIFYVSSLPKTLQSQKLYHERMVDAAVTLGANRTSAHEELLNVVQFEFKIRDLAQTETQTTTYTNLHSLPNTPIDWSAFFISYTNNMAPQLAANTSLISFPTLLNTLGNILENTSSRTIVNYLQWKLIESLNRSRKSIISIGSDGDDDVGTQIPRWKFCLNLVRQKLPVSINALFVRRYFHESTKKAVEQMFENVRRQLAVQFSATPWLKPKNREKILRRLSEVRATIGAPDELHNVTELQNYYASLGDLSGDSFLESLFRVNVFNDKKKFAYAHLSINESVKWYDDYLMNVSKISANYENHMNSIYILSGLLEESQIYSSERPEYLNYGSAGFVVGHEIMHGFSDAEYLTDIWTGDAMSERDYEDRIKCYVDQYGNVTEPTTNMKFDGRKSQPDNVADNSGIRASYMAYRNWMTEQGKPEPRLPGLENLEPQQMFWLSFAQTWCSVQTKEAMLEYIRTNRHAPKQMRVMLTLMNTPEFANDYSCPIGSKMNPTDKCKLW